jgi:hypothetical protein
MTTATPSLRSLSSAREDELPPPPARVLWCELVAGWVVAFATLWLV